MGAKGSNPHIFPAGRAAASSDQHPRAKAACQHSLRTPGIHNIIQ